MIGRGRGGGSGRGAGRGGRGGGRSRVSGRGDRDSGNPYTSKVPKKFLLGRVIYVGNLGWRTKWQELKDHFKVAGNILRADIMMGADGRSRGCGLVEFSSIEEAKDAIETLNGSVLEDRVITVREDKETSITADAASAPRRIFVGNLHYHTRWMDLKDHFQVVGQVVRADVAEDLDTGRSKGFGVVEMATIEDVENAMQQLQESELNGRKIFLKPDDEKATQYVTEDDSSGAVFPSNEGGVLGRLSKSLPGTAITDRLGGPYGGGEASTTRVHVGNLSWHTSDEDLIDHMASAGPVAGCTVATHEDTGKSKGWALVEFISTSGASQAVELLQGSDLHGRRMSVKLDQRN